MGVWGGGEVPSAEQTFSPPPVPRCSAAVVDQQPCQGKEKCFRCPSAGEGGVATCGSSFAPVNGKARVDHLDHRAVIRQ